MGSMQRSQIEHARRRRDLASRRVRTWTRAIAGASMTLLGAIAGLVAATAPGRAASPSRGGAVSRGTHLPSHSHSPTPGERIRPPRHVPEPASDAAGQAESSTTEEQASEERAREEQALEERAIEEEAAAGAEAEPPVVAVSGGS